MSAPNNDTNANQQPGRSFAPAPGSVTRRDPSEAAESHRRQLWEQGNRGIHSIFTKGTAVRVVMLDGRSGTVQWDTAPNDQAHA